MEQQSVGSLEGLDGLDDRSGVVAYPPERAVTLPAAPVGPLSAHVVRKPILVLLCEHREGVAHIRAARIEKHQLTHEIIQRGAQVVDDLTDDRAPPVGRAGRPSRVDVKAERPRSRSSWE